MSKKRLWTDAPEKSPVWLDPADKPLERLYLVTDVPTRPENLSVNMAWSDAVWPKSLPDKPSPALYLGALEWSWSPMHSRLDSYYLSYTADHWLVFLHNLEDGGFESEWTWEWYLYAIAEHVLDDEHTIAFWLIYELLRQDHRSHELDHFHLVSDTGVLSVGDFLNIGKLVWETDDETC